VSTIVAPGSLVADAELDAMRGIAEQGLPAFLTDLERLVNVDCGSYTPGGVNDVADWVADDMLSNGGRVERLPDPSGRFGDTVVGTFEGTTGAGPRLLLIGHMDTVFEEGTAEERPFRIEDG
jgi:glutamate carboxypeptidase